MKLHLTLQTIIAINHLITCLSANLVVLPGDPLEKITDLDLEISSHNDTTTECVGCLEDERKSVTTGNTDVSELPSDNYEMYEIDETQTEKPAPSDGNNTDNKLETDVRVSDSTNDRYKYVNQNWDPYDPYYQHKKTRTQLRNYIEGSTYEDGFNFYSNAVMEPEYYQYFWKRKEIALGKNRKRTTFIDKNFYWDEFNRFDVNNDGYLSSTEIQWRQYDIDNLINPSLGYPLDSPTFTNTLEKTLEHMSELLVNDGKNGNIYLPNWHQKLYNEETQLLDYNNFVKYRIIGDLIDGYALYKLHDTWGKTNGRAHENGYICNAEFGWMMRYWISLCDIYNGPYDGQLKLDDFYYKYSVTHDRQFRILELAAWKARFMDDVLFERRIY